MNDLALITLSLLLITSNAYWAWQTHVLINKLMSRNYYEFKEASVTTEKPKKKIIADPFMDDLSSMSEFNV